MAILIWVLSCCSCEKKPKTSKERQKGQAWLETLILDSVRVDVKTPDREIRADLLLLQGWNFPRTSWCDSTTFCWKALERGYRLFMPETGKSVYQSQNFPETREEWQMYPTGSFLWDTLIPFLKNKKEMGMYNRPCFVAGISTGGRGAALALLNIPNEFEGGASLSGDFEQTSMPTDNLMVGYYGPYEKFKERWEGKDNPGRRIKEWHKPFYIAHGLADSVVPPSQSIHLFKQLQDNHPDYFLHGSFQEGMGHNYAFWESQTDSILNFFDLMIPR